MLTHERIACQLVLNCSSNTSEWDEEYNRNSIRGSSFLLYISMRHIVKLSSFVVNVLCTLKRDDVFVPSAQLYLSPCGVS